MTGPAFITAHLTSVGDMLRRCRLEAGLTQQQVADEMGTTQAHVSFIEAQGSRLNLRTIERYLEACGARLVIGWEGAA